MSAPYVREPQSVKAYKYFVRASLLEKGRDFISVDMNGFVKVFVFIGTR